MKNRFGSILIVVLFNSVFILVSCHHTDQWETESDALLSRMVELERRHTLLNIRIDSLWDVTTAKLESGLPADLPSVDREIFLHARNADHIRMFMSFKKLDTDLQLLVYNAGEEDKILADQARDLLEQRLEYERAKNQFLQRVEQKDLVASRIYANKFRLAAESI